MFFDVKTKQFKSSDWNCRQPLRLLASCFFVRSTTSTARVAVLLSSGFKATGDAHSKSSKYGKPSYGAEPEMDEKVEVPILILQTPVRVKARSTSSVNNESVDQCFICPTHLPT